ncbi:MAG: Mlc titration factor MtfA (ptsG expression regulator) [Marinoscillum sp.]
MVVGIYIGLGLIASVIGWSVLQVLRGVEVIPTTLSLRWSLNTDQKSVLEKHFRFYSHLPSKSKRIFEARVARFISLKEFVPRHMPEVTEEMKLLIASSAIQITFGFPGVFLSYFKYIIVFPDQFLSNEGKRYHKGEVNPKARAIALSWRHFVEGYASSEGVNLGLHEMAHALQLENIVVNKEFDFLSSEAINSWLELADKEIIRLRQNTESIFRGYGATNQEEFFAVAVELFFERPKDFQSYNEHLYKALSNVLRQDPIHLYEEL